MTDIMIIKMDKIIRGNIHVNWTKKNRNCKTMEKFVKKCLMKPNTRCIQYKKFLKECKKGKL